MVTNQQLDELTEKQVSKLLEDISIYKEYVRSKIKNFTNNYGVFTNVNQRINFRANGSNYTIKELETKLRENKNNIKKLESFTEEFCREKISEGIQSLYNTRDILHDVFGKESVQFYSENDPYFVVRIPDYWITEGTRHHKIRGSYLVFYIKDSFNLLELDKRGYKFLVDYNPYYVRSLLNPKEARKNYRHSHYNNGGKFCFGSSQVQLALSKINGVSNPNPIDVKYYLTAFLQGLKWQSNAGTPYEYISDIVSGSNRTKKVKYLDRSEYVNLLDSLMRERNELVRTVMFNDDTALYSVLRKLNLTEEVIEGYTLEESPTKTFYDNSNIRFNGASIPIYVQDITVTPEEADKYSLYKVNQNTVDALIKMVKAGVTRVVNEKIKQLKQQKEDESNNQQHELQR